MYDSKKRIYAAVGLRPSAVRGLGVWYHTLYGLVAAGLSRRGSVSI